ncbi:MAG: hypothetical protein HPY50_05250 [Firmicutes bacterium]|nr:hypothetical protein [Bacillota bacterium]
MTNPLHYYREQGDRIVRIPCLTPPDLRELDDEETETLLLLLAVDLLQKGWEPEVIQGYLNKNVRVMMTLDAIEKSATKEKMIEELNDEDLEVEIIDKADYLYSRAKKLYDKSAAILNALKEVDKSNVVYGH